MYGTSGFNIFIDPFQFVDHLTIQTRWSGHSLTPKTQDVQAARVQLFNRNVVLVDTPSFEDTYVSDFTVLKLIGEWLKRR